MSERWIQDGGKSLWRQLGEKALNTLVKEAVRASVDLVKKAKLRRQEAAFDDRRKHDKKADVSEPDDTAADSDDPDESGNDDAAAVPPESGGEGPVDFVDYVASQRR